MEGSVLPREWLLQALELEPTRGQDPTKASRDAVRVFLQAVQEAWKPEHDTAAAASMLTAFAQRLRQARPADIVLRKALDEALTAIPRGSVEVSEALTGFLARAEAAEAAVLNAAGDLLRPGTRVLTLGYHSLVEALLIRHGDLLEGVTVSEGRPLVEGGRLTEAVGAQTIPVRLITEAELELVAPECDLAMTAAERILPDGSVVATVGTAVLARVCSGHRVPFYVLAESDRWVPEGTDLAHFAWERRSPADVLSQAPRGVQVINVAHDLTPPSLVTGYITEEGLLPAAGIEDRFRNAA